MIKKILVALLSLVLSTYFLVIGIEGVVIYHEAQGRPSMVLLFSDLCIFSALVVLVFLVLHLGTSGK